MTVAARFDFHTDQDGSASVERDGVTVDVNGLTPDTDYILMVDAAHTPQQREPGGGGAERR
jgi:hypothetical protein